MDNPVNVKIVCPKCDNQELHENSGVNKKIVTCSKCTTTFSFLFAKIRSKRSRGNRQNNTREFDIRVFLNDGSEDFIQFVKSGYNDIELRSRDTVIFSYLGDKLRVIQNLKISKYTKISEPQCFIATCAYGKNSNEVIFLRKWRDEVLLVSNIGRQFVKLYYLISPQLVKYSKGSVTAKVTMTFTVYLLLKTLGYKKHITTRIERE